MEPVTLQQDYEAVLPSPQESPSSEGLDTDQPASPQQSTPFILANTIASSLQEIREKHIIPVFIKDNEPVISQVDFIEAVAAVVEEVYPGEHILSPSVRLSHPIKGRIPEARNKPAGNLLEHEKTLYYERMAFVVEIPSITGVVGGNTLSLMVGGVKSYHLDHLYNKKGVEEHFKLFVGFKNRVCTNLCIATDGLKASVAVKALGELMAVTRTLLESYNERLHLHTLQSFCHLSLTEEQFARLTGRCRMYPHLPKSLQKDIPQLLLGDTQLGMVVRDYYRDNSFCREQNGDIQLWKLYNLFTGAVRSSYIDQFAERNAQVFAFIHALKEGLEHKQTNWFLQ